MAFKMKGYSPYDKSPMKMAPALIAKLIPMALSALGGKDNSGGEDDTKTKKT